VFTRGWLIVRVLRRLLLITKEEVHVLQELIAKQCQLIVPCTVAKAALYEVENYRLKQMDDIMVTSPRGSTCTNADPREP
jgi:hypothetical protein